MAKLLRKQEEKEKLHQNEGKKLPPEGQQKLPIEKKEKLPHLLMPPWLPGARQLEHGSWLLQMDLGGKVSLKGIFSGNLLCMYLLTLARV